MFTHSKPTDTTAQSAKANHPLELSKPNIPPQSKTIAGISKLLGKVWYALTLASPPREIELLVQEAQQRARKPWFKHPPTDVD